MDMSKIPAWVEGALTPVDKLAVHKRGLRHKAVSVFVTAQNRVLLQRRALGKYHTPGLWANSCCTHPQWNEPAEACARRRLQEELGITLQDLEHRGRVEYRADVGGGLTEHEVVEVFRVESDPDITLHPDADEVMETRWVTLDALEAELDSAPERFTPWLHIYMEEHAALIFDGTTESTTE